MAIKLIIRIIIIMIIIIIIIVIIIILIIIILFYAICFDYYDDNDVTRSIFSHKFGSPGEFPVTSSQLHVG